MTPFGVIMKRVVEATPDAIGGAFAASDGELFLRTDKSLWCFANATAK